VGELRGPATTVGDRARGRRRDHAQRAACARAVGACGWCGELIPIRAAGRLPKWCSRTCRQRAWEAAKFAERGDRPVEVVTRYLRAVPDNPADWVIHLDHLVRQMNASANGEWYVARAELRRLLDAAREVVDRVPLRTPSSAGWHD
jgi:hypothetical protein